MTERILAAFIRKSVKVLLVLIPVCLLILSVVAKKTGLLPDSWFASWC